MSDETKQATEMVIPTATLLMLREMMHEIDLQAPELSSKMLERFRKLTEPGELAQQYPESMKLVKAVISDVEEARRGRV